MGVGVAISVDVAVGVKVDIGLAVGMGSDVGVGLGAAVGVISNAQETSRITKATTDRIRKWVLTAGV